MRPLEQAQIGETLRPHSYTLTPEIALFAARSLGKDHLEAEESGDGIYFDTWVENRMGEKVIVGKAGVPAAPRSAD